MQAVRFLPAIALVACSFLTGCGDGSSNTSKPTNQSSSVITAPVDYLGAVAKAKQSSVKAIDVAAISKAIQMFQVEQDRLPKDLNELVALKYLAEVPKAPYGQKIVYDAKAGTVKVVPE